MASKTFSKEYSINGTKHWSLDLIITEVLSNEANRIAENKTPLHYELWLRDVASSYTFSQYKIGRSVSINGTTVYNVERENSASLSLGNNASLKLAEGDTTVAHSADGTKTISVSFSIDMAKASYTPGPLSGSGSMTLTTIARASQPTLSSTEFNMGASVTIYTNRRSTAFTHTVECYNASNTKLFTIGTAKAVTDSVPWNTDNLFANCESAQSLSGYIKVTTYNGSTQIGDAKTVDFKATIPDTVDYRPTASMTLAPTPSTIGGLSGVTEYVQGKSYVNATFSATPQKSASMKRYTVGINGSQVGVDSDETLKTIKSVLLTGSGKVTVIGYAKDTRDLYTEISKEISVTPYGNPYISSHPSYGIKCFRCDSNGNASDEGTYLKYQFKVTWYSLASDKNALVCKALVQSVDEDFGSITITGTASGGGSSNGYKRWYNFDGIIKSLPNGQTFTMNTTKSYEVTFSFTDTIGSSAPPLEFSIPSASVDLHLGGNKAAFGEYAEEDKTVSVAEDWVMNVKGKLKLNGIEMSHYVVSRSSQAIPAAGQRSAATWNVTKWNTGLVECYCRVAFNNISCNTTWGALYAGAIGNSNIPYPVKFISFPMVQVTPEFTSSANFMICTTDTEVHSTTNSPMYQAIRPVSSTMNVILNYYVRGYI